MPLAELRNVQHSYGATPALQDVSLTIPSGAIYGLIGPNGAGKTTTLRLLATLLRPTAGDIVIGPYRLPAHQTEARALLGYMPDTLGHYPDTTPTELLTLLGQAHGLRGAALRTSIANVLELTDLAHRRHDQISALSLGMRQRLNLARALIHDPALLLLDEPAGGLDPRGRNELREILRELATLGKTVVISSHVLADLADICTHAAILHRGRISASGPLDTLLGTPDTRTLQITVLSGTARAETVVASHAHCLAQRWLAPPADDTGTLVVTTDGASADDAALLQHLIAQGVVVAAFGPQGGTREAGLLRLTAPEE